MRNKRVIFKNNDQTIYGEYAEAMLKAYKQGKGSISFMEGLVEFGDTVEKDDVVEVQISVNRNICNERF